MDFLLESMAVCLFFHSKRIIIFSEKKAQKNSWWRLLGFVVILFWTAWVIFWIVMLGGIINLTIYNLDKEEPLWPFFLVDLLFGGMAIFMGHQWFKLILCLKRSK